MNENTNIEIPNESPMPNDLKDLIIGCYLQGASHETCVDAVEAMGYEIPIALVEEMYAAIASCMAQGLGDLH